MELAIRLGLTTPSRGLALDPDAAVLIARMTTPPTDPRKAAIDACITSLKSAGLWSKLDMFQIYAVPDSQSALLDWVNPSLTPSATAAFTPNVGFAPAGGTVVNTGLKPTTASVKMSQNSQTFGFASPTNEGNSGSIAGAWDGTRGTSMLIRDGAGAGGYRVNQVAVNSTGASNFVASGIWAVARTAANVVKLLQNATERWNTTTASDSTLADAFFVLGGLTTAGGASKTFSACYAGQGLSNSEISAMSTIIRAYMTAMSISLP